MLDGVIIKDVSKDEAEEDTGRQESGQASFQGGIQTNREEEEEEKDKEEEKRTRSNSTRRSRVMTTIKKKLMEDRKEEAKTPVAHFKRILIPYSPLTPTPKLI